MLCIRKMNIMDLTTHPHASAVFSSTIFVNKPAKTLMVRCFHLVPHELGMNVKTEHLQQVVLIVKSVFVPSVVQSKL